MEQVIAGAQVGLADDAFTCCRIYDVVRVKEDLFQFRGVDAAGDDTCAQILVCIVTVCHIGQSAAAVVVNEDEIQRIGVVVLDLAAGHQGPCFCVGTGVHCHAGVGRLDIEQVVVVEDVGGDKGIGADGVRNLCIVLTEVIRCSHPVGIEDGVSCYSHLIAGGVIGLICYIIPSADLLCVLIRGHPGGRQGEGAAHRHGVTLIGRTALLALTTAGAVHPNRALLRGCKAQNRAAALAGDCGKAVCVGAERNVIAVTVDLCTVVGEFECAVF